MIQPDAAPNDTRFASQARVACSLREQGWIALTEFLSPALLAALQRDCDEAEAGGRLRPAGTGRDKSARAQSELRGDSILWLEHEASSAQAQLLAHLDLWRQALNRELWLGMEAVEAHYALYPAGAGYARHRDRFQDNDARVLSLVIYLNPDWCEEHGGALRLHLPDGPHDVSPRLGTAVLFLSADIEHEVMPASRVRRSIAGWFRRRALGQAGSTIP